MTRLDSYTPLQLENEQAKMNRLWVQVTCSLSRLDRNGETDLNHPQFQICWSVPACADGAFGLPKSVSWGRVL